MLLLRGSGNFVGEEADRRYLETFKVAAHEGQTVMGNALEHLPVVPRPVILAAMVLVMIDTWRDLQRQWRECPPLDVHLKDYGALLDGCEEDEHKSNPSHMRWRDEPAHRRPKLPSSLSGLKYFWEPRPYVDG